MGVLSPDSKFYRGLSTATDLVIVNLLTLAASIPVVTAGAALTACARVCGETVREEDGYLVRTWWAAFRKNLAQSMGWWIPCAFLLGAGAAESWFLSGIDDSRLAGGLNGLLIVGLAAVLGVLSWIAPLQAFFENTAIGHMGNAAVLAGGYLWRTLANVAVVLAPLAAFVAVPQARMAAVWFVAIIGVAFTAYMQAIVEKAALDKLLEAAHN